MDQESIKSPPNLHKQAPNSINMNLEVENILALDLGQLSTGHNTQVEDFYLLEMFHLIKKY